MERETSEFSRILRDKIRKMMNDHADGMISAQCADYAEYKRMCGVIEGLAYAERDLLDLTNTLEKGDS